MWLKPHQWIDPPYFKTQRKKAVDVVRTPTVSFMLFENRYYNPETGKFNTDKLSTLNSCCMADLEESYSNESTYGNYTTHRPTRRYTKENNKWFTPKDNDFDEECRRDEERSRHSQSEPKREEREPVKPELVRKERKVAKVTEVTPKEEDFYMPQDPFSSYRQLNTSPFWDEFVSFMNEANQPPPLKKGEQATMVNGEWIVEVWRKY